MSVAIDPDDQITVRTIKTRHSDALRDLQQNVNDRLLRIKNDPSRQISRCNNTVNDGSSDPEATCIEDSLPVKQVWAGALEASRLSVGNRLAVTRRDLLSHYDAVGAGHVANKICNLEKLIILISSTREKVDTTVMAGHQRIRQIVSASPLSGTSMMPLEGEKSEDLSFGFDLPEKFRSGSTQAYQKNQLDENSIAILEELIYINEGKPLTLSCGVYSDEDTLEQPIDVTAVAIIANGILYVALTIDPSTGHEMDQNAYGVKKVKIFTTDQSVNVMEKTVEIIPPKGSRFPLPPPPLVECREEGFVANLNYKFRGTEKAKERMHSIIISDSDDDVDDDSDSDDNDDDDDSDGDIAQDGDGDSDSSGDSEGDQDLALFLVETGNLACLPAPILRRRSLDSLTDAILGLKAATRSQGTNTSLYDTGYQSKCALGTASKIEMKVNEDESLPDRSCRRIRLFDLEEVKSVTCSSSSFVLQRASDAVAFTGSLQSAITDSILDARLLVVGDTSFQWTRNAAASGWMCKQPTTSIGSSKGQEIGGVGGTGAGIEFVKGDRSNRRFLSLRDSTLRYDSLQTLSSQSDICVNASDSVKHPASPSSFPPMSLPLSPCLSPTPSLSPFEPPSALVYSPTGMLKVLGDKTTPKSSYAQSDCPSPYPSPFMISPTPSPLPTTAAATTSSSSSPGIGKSRTISSAISSMFSKKATHTKNKEKSPTAANNDSKSYFGSKKKDRHQKESNGVLDITPSSTVTTRSFNPRYGAQPVITLATAKETLCVCYEHMDPPPSLPFGHQGYEDLYSGASASKSVNSVRDTVHALWTKELRRSIAQQTKKPLLVTKNRMESEWSHESSGFVCVAVDAVVEPLQYTSSPSPPLSRRSSEARDECDTDSAQADSGSKCTHAALYCMRTIKHNFTQKIPRENIPSGTPSKSAMSMSKDGVSSALLGDYSAKVERSLAAGSGSKPALVGAAMQCDEDATGDISYTSTGSGAGAGADPGSDSKNSSTREHADALMVSYSDRDRDISGNIGMVNNAYYVCVGFVTSAGEAQSTQLIKVLTERFNSNLGTDLTSMLQCGDILVFGGTNGFVGIGVGVPHSGGGSNTDHESSVAIVCVFPKGTPSTSAIHADGNVGVGVVERSAERKIEDKMFSGSTELYNSSSSTALPCITNGIEDYSGDIIPVPSSPLTQAGREGLRSDRESKELVIEVVGGTQEEIEIEKEIERKKEREIEIEIGVETRKEEDKDKEAPVGSSMAVLRARGHGYNSNITCLATHSLELENEMRFYCAGDDCGGVSLWRIVPRTAPSVPPPATHHTGDRNRDRDWEGDRHMDVHRGRNREESKESGFTGEDIDNGNESDIDNVDDADDDENENDGESSITVGSVLQCFLNVNCLLRFSHISEERSCADTGERNDEEKVQDKVKDERIVTLQFLPNSELLLVGTNKRLLLIVIGAMQNPRPSSGICGDVWNVSTLDPYGSSDAFSPSASARAREQSLSHWLSQSPSPYKRQNTNKNVNMNMNMNMGMDTSKESERYFISWVELDHVPPHCEGIFSMSVGSESGQSGGVSGTEQEQEQGQGEGLELGKEQEQEHKQEQEMSIFLWKVIVQVEVPLLEREGSKSSSLSEVLLTPRQSDDDLMLATAAAAAAAYKSKSKAKPLTNKSEKRKGGALFSLPSFFSSTATAQQSGRSNSVPVSATAPVPVQVPVPVPALALGLSASDNVTPNKQALNLNLKEEKETPCCVLVQANASTSRTSSRDNSNSTNKRSNVDVEVDGDSDCRVYRLKWSEEMFLSAFKNSRSIPQRALEDHLTKIF